MARPTRAVYSARFQQEAVRMVMEQGLPVLVAAERLCVPMKTLSHWVRVARVRKWTRAGEDRHHLILGELAAENARLKQELAEVCLERDLLKETAAYFSIKSRHEARVRQTIAAEPYAFLGALHQAA